MQDQRSDKKAVTGGIDFYDEIGYPVGEEEIITVCLSKLSEINKTQIAGINSSDSSEVRGRLRKHNITGNPET